MVCREMREKIIITCSGEKQSTVGAILQDQLKFYHFHEAFMKSVHSQKLSPTKSTVT